MKNVNIYTSIILFTVSCSTNLPLVDEQIESSSQDVNKVEKKNIDSFSSDSGVQSFMDGMLFLEQGDYARAILEFQESIEKGIATLVVLYT